MLCSWILKHNYLLCCFYCIAQYRFWVSRVSTPFPRPDCDVISGLNESILENDNIPALLSLSHFIYHLKMIWFPMKNRLRKIVMQNVTWRICIQHKEEAPNTADTPHHYRLIATIPVDDLCCLQHLDFFAINHHDFNADRSGAIFVDSSSTFGETTPHVAL